MGSPGARPNSNRGLNNRTAPSVDTADLPVARNEEYEAEIVGIGHEGKG